MTDRAGPARNDPNNLDLDYESIPLFAYLDRAAETHGGRPAVSFHGAITSYAKLRRQAESLAAGLREKGVRKGDRVAVMLPNTPQAVLTWFGVLKTGAAAVMVNPLYMEMELKRLLADAAPKALVILDLLYEKHKDVIAEFDLETIAVTRIADGLPFPKNLLYPFKAKREGKYPRLQFDGGRLLPFRALFPKNKRYSADDIDPAGDLAALQYTGGVTGAAKGVMLTHANMAANLRQCRAVLRVMPEKPECFLGLLPYFHIYGLTVCVNLAVAVSAVMAPIPRFVPAEVMAAIMKTRPTVFPGTPSVYTTLMRRPEAAKGGLSGIRYCVSGSAPMAVDDMRRFHELTNAQILEGYGLTEASPITHLNPLDGVRKPGSIGLPFPDTQAAVVDMETGERTTAPGSRGELAVKGPQVMLGYWNRPRDTADALRNGWLHTGDIASIDEDGYYFILDRKKDLIISGGYNVYPREVEEALLTHPGVKEAVAVGVPHKTRGEAVKVYIVPEDGASLTRREVTDHVRERLANYKIPKYVEFRESLPKNLVGKVLRRVLREENETPKRAET